MPHASDWKLRPPVGRGPVPKVPPLKEERPAGSGRGLVPEVRMGDRDQPTRPFGKAATVQLGDAPLGHDRLDMAARGDNAGALAQERRDA